MPQAQQYTVKANLNNPPNFKGDGVSISQFSSLPDAEEICRILATRLPQYCYWVTSAIDNKPIKGGGQCTK